MQDIIQQIQQHQAGDVAHITDDNIRDLVIFWATILRRFRDEYCKPGEDLTAEARHTSKAIRASLKDMNDQLFGKILQMVSNEAQNAQDENRKPFWVGPADFNIRHTSKHFHMFR